MIRKILVKNNSIHKRCLQLALILFYILKRQERRYIVQSHHIISLNRISFHICHRLRRAGYIGYLIIDNSKSQDNVYFLTEVSEKDLMNFTLSDSVTLPEVDIVYAEPEKQAEEEKPETTETDEKDKVEDDIQMPEDKSPFGTYLLIALVAVGAAAGGYYFKVYKPKHEYDDEDEMEEDEDESEDSESEKREVDDADEQEEQENAGTEVLKDEDFNDEVLEDEEEEQE